MKISKKASLSVIALSILLTSCATTKLAEGEELVKFIKSDYKVQYKTELTEKELREDCDMLNYIVYNTYAGIDEAIENGFDLNATVEKIYQETLKKKNGLGTYNTSDFNSIVRQTFSKELKNNDQHIHIGGNLRDSINLYYTDIYFEKRNDKFVVNKLQLDSNQKIDKVAVANFEKITEIKPGMEYTGNPDNLYEMITDDGILYRYGVLTSKKIKTLIIPVDNQKITVPAHTEIAIPTKSNWTGLKSTQKTVYMSLGDCSQTNGISNSAVMGKDYWDRYLNQLAEAAKGKEQLIFDLRSNPGGYMQFPAMLLSAALYNQHMDKEFQENMRAFFFNKVSEDCVILVSPFTEQTYKEIYTKNGAYTDLYDQLKPEAKKFYENYWKHMKTRPIRTHVPQAEFATTFEEFPEPDFKGDIYVLINRDSGSAAEFGTQMTYLLQDKGINVHLVGENTWGGMKYGGMFTSYLPNSGIYAYVGVYFGEAPTASQNPSWHGEGYGWFPDYWATNDTILNTLENLIDDPELRTTLQGLDKNQL